MTSQRLTSQRPAMVSGATWLTVAAVAMTGVTALMTIVFKDDLVRAWAADRSDAGAVEPPAFVPVAVTMFVVVALLAAVLIAFFREGHNWSRILLSALMVMIGIATFAIVRTNPPALFLVVAIVSAVIDVLALAALWHKDTRAFCGRVDQPV
jgi:cytochrome c biogenesis protein CcdA